ncbi:MAG: tetratricopeptide repeat protein [Cyanobacteria bacterium J06626_4]
MNRGVLPFVFIACSSMISCATPEPLVPLQSVLIPDTLFTTLPYPLFLEDLKAAEGYRQAGLTARQADDFATAIAALKTAVALAPRTVSGYVLLGWTQHLAGERDEAIAVLNRAIELDAEYIPALNALGIAYLVNGDIDAAIATHTQAKTLNPENEIAYYNLSLAYQRLPDVDAAIRHANRATELEPYNPHPWVALALAHWSNQDEIAARAAYSQVLQLDARYYQAGHLDYLTRAGFSRNQIQQVVEMQQQVI